MEFIDKLKKIKLAINDIMGESKPETVKMEMAGELQDGTLVMFSPALEVGATVMLTNDEGTEPLADGDYQLAENKTITVYEGKVSFIKEETPAEVLSEVLEQRLAALETENPKIKELETKLAEQSETITKQTGVIKELFEAVEKLSEAKPTREIAKPENKGKFNPEAIAMAIQEIKKSKNK